jgi:hypothetical protein
MPTHEQDLCRAYRAARIAFDLDPHSEPRLLAFLGAQDDLIAFILADHGAPAEDWANFVRFEVDANGELQEMPLMHERLAHWLVAGAESVAPGFGRAA